jgi:malate dehydrogenase (decarboxylating)
MYSLNSKLLRKISRFNFTSGIKDKLKKKYHDIQVVRHKGEQLLRDSLLNKSHGFSREERERLDIRGLVPPAVLTMDQQMNLIMNEFQHGIMHLAAKNEDDEVMKSGVTPQMIRKWKLLDSIYNRDETLYYYILMKNIKEMAPIVYTPTVGWVCKHFSSIFRRLRGMFISINDKGHISTILNNWPNRRVDAIVVTDGSRILGLGDLGIGGLGISKGKLDLYVGAGGFHPQRILPVVIDVGTNNQELLDNPYYLGIRKNRVEGEEYQELIDEFVASATHKWPNVLIQFEDFQFKHAMELLNRYREEFLIFNDDIQGTSAVVLAGLIGALRVQGLRPKAITETRFVVVGAGSAGLGVLYKLHLFLQRYGLSDIEAGENFWVLDKDGLITQKRENASRRAKKYLRKETEDEGMGLLDVIKKYKPHCLIGLSGQGGIFTPEVLQEMTKIPDGRKPIIFPLSNPTSKSECTAEDVFKYTNGEAIFGSGSPFPDIEVEGKLIRSNQTNNVYVYPGLALGAYLGKCQYISDNMIIAAAEALTELLEPVDIAEKAIFPPLEEIRECSVHIAARVMEQAYREGHLKNREAKKYLQKSLEDLKKFITMNQWDPSYRQLVFKLPGVDE